VRTLRSNLDHVDVNAQSGLSNKSWTVCDAASRKDINCKIFFLQILGLRRSKWTLPTGTNLTIVVVGEVITHNFSWFDWIICTLISAHFIIFIVLSLCNLNKLFKVIPENFDQTAKKWWAIPLFCSYGWVFLIQSVTCVYCFSSKQVIIWYFSLIHIFY